MSERALVPVERIARATLRLRGRNVMLDSDLADLYGVRVKALNQAVKRNRKRFPADFMFRLTVQEAESLRSQIVTATPSAAAGAQHLTLSLSRAWRCCRAFCAGRGQCV